MSHPCDLTHVTLMIDTPYSKPIISPASLTSMSSALGCEGNPGNVSILPAKAYKNPAPTDALISAIGKA